MSSEALFRRNLKAMRDVAPQLAELLEKIETPKSKLVRQGDGWNIDLGHAMFYDSEAEDFAERQLTEFFGNPIRIEFSTPDRVVDPPCVVTREWVNTLLDRVDAARITPSDAHASDDGRYLVVLGVGLGYHIGRLIERYGVVNVVLIEQFAEFIWHSAHLQPWWKWMRLLKKRKGGVTLILGEDPNLVMTALTNALRLEQGGLMDGTYIFTHYRSTLVRDLHRKIDENMVFLGSSRGFFEDECVMLYNTIRNLAHSDHLLWLTRPRLEKSTPVFVIGAGPSFDRCVDQIKANRAGAVVIACGSGLENCLSNGIRPDFHLELENTSGQAEIIARAAARHDLSGITLIGAASIHPDIRVHFDDCILFHRDTISSTALLCKPLEEVYMSGPTVTNGGLRFALGMGFTEIYLFGTDLGTRVESEHHSKKSAYYVDQEFMDSFPEHLAVRRFDRRQDANFGGVVYTNTDFLFARLFMYNCIKLYPGAKVYNCSDGAHIPGAIPLLPKLLKLPAPAPRRAEELARLRRDLEQVKAGETIDAAEIERLSVHMDGWVKRLRRTIAKIRRTRPHPFKAYEELLGHFFPRKGLTGEDERHENVTIQLFVGSLLTLFQAYFRFYRRVPAEQREDLFDVFLPLYGEVLEELVDYQKGLITMLKAACENEDMFAALAMDDTVRKRA